MTIIISSQPKKKIIFVQPTIPKYRESFFKGIYEKIPDNLIVYASDMDIGVISQKSIEKPWLRKLESHKKIIFGLSWQKGVKKIPISKEDIIIISGAPKDLSNIFLLIRAKLNNAKIVWWGHFWSSSSTHWKLKLRMSLLKFVDVVLFYTENEIAEFRNQFPNFTELPVFALNNGLDKSEINVLRKPYDAKDRRYHILFIGRVTLKSNLSLLLEALSSESCKNIYLNIIGDGQYITNLQSYAKQLGIEERIYWHGGLIDEAKIASIANQCRLFVYPGAVGLSLIHALDYGLPAIVHNNRWTHMPEIAALENEVNGLMFHENDSNSLAKCISELIRKEDILNKMSSNAVALTNKTFNSDDMTNRFFNMINFIKSKQIIN